MKEKTDRNCTPVQFQKHELLLAIIRALNTTDNEDDSINCIIEMIRSYTGFSAVALRIRKENDYPYYSANGFSKDFTDTERCLLSGEMCSCDVNNKKFRRDLECICGMVLDRDTPAGQGCFTEYGSFWINSPEDISGSSFIDESRRHFRLKCISEGYSSIAIVPVYAGNELTGLLQMNDRRPGLFDMETILFLESLCSAIGPSILMKSRESAMYEKNRTLEAIIEERTMELLCTIRDKDRLLDEVNHRINNNLLIISSLINLQVMKESNEHIRDALNGALNRINSMGIIHQRLYSSSDLDNIDIEDYIVALYKMIILTYCIDEETADLKLRCSGIAVNIDTAIPCGLIFNEILTNSVKHAAINGRQLRLNIFISQDDNTYNILINDNGPGIKPGFSIDRDGRLGMELIKALVKQLDGTMDFYNNDGLTFELRISREKKEEMRWKPKMS